MRKIGIIGCGALSQVVAENLNKVLPGEYEIGAFFARTEAKVQAMAEKYGGAGFTNLQEFLQRDLELVIEMAGTAAVVSYGKDILAAGKDLVVVSIGALADKDFFQELQAVALEKNRKLYIVNGAVGGFDLLQTMAMMNRGYNTSYLQAEIENIKTPESLAGAPGLGERELSSLKEEEVFFGGIGEAILNFPKNVNVAVAAALASGSENMKVSIKSKPGLKENRHIIRLNNDMIQAELKIFSRPDEKNPRSSTSTAWSVLALLRNLASPVVFF